MAAAPPPPSGYEALWCPNVPLAFKRGGESYKVMVGVSEDDAMIPIASITVFHVSLRTCLTRWNGDSLTKVTYVVLLVSGDDSAVWHGDLSCCM